ncbi:MAG: histidinol dehydrogenase [Candidatus Caldarchaeales archaeon]
MPIFQIYTLKQIPEDVLKRIMKRSILDIKKIEEDVKRILEDVREKGDEAIAEFLSQQVGRKVKPEEIVIKKEEVARAYKNIEPRLLKAIKHLIRNVRKFHRRQAPRSWMIKIENGVYAGQRVIPLESAGLYVPSGKASYPSVAAMVTIPASIAGVSRIAVASPPFRNEMMMDPATLVTAHLSGAHEFYIMGGAHAIAAFAYGTRLIKPVDVIAGPGGPYTYVSKLLVRDIVRTDLPAGPSEALVLADGTLPAEWVAWNVLNEAEHGPDSAVVLVTTSFDYAEKVREEIDKAIEVLPEPRRSYVKENAQKYSGIIVCDDLDEAIDFINSYAPEHLAIDSKNARKIFQKYSKKLKNFGTVCLNTPISAGNFGIGPNSTLPTGGYARLYSGLNVDTFLKKPTVEELRGPRGFKKMYETVQALAEYEGFPAHARAMSIRR